MNTNEHILDSLHDTIDDVVLVLNSKFEIEEINRKGYEVFNTDNDSVVGKKCYNVICNSGKPHDHCPLLCLQNNTAPAKNQIIENNNTLFKVNISKITLDNGEEKYIDVLHDVTEFVEHEKLLKKNNDEYQALNEEYQATIDELEEKNNLISEEREKFELLFANMNSGFAYHEIITDEHAKPCDYKFIDCNSKFEELTGLKRENIIGKTVLEILPNTERHWIDNYGKVALLGEPMEFTSYANAFNKYYETRSYSPKKGFFAVTFNDVTERELAKKGLENKNKAYEAVNKELEDSLERTQEVNNNLEDAYYQIESLLKGAKEVLTFNPFEITSRKLFDACKELTGATSGYVALLSENGEENDVLFLDRGDKLYSVDGNLPIPIRELQGEAYDLLETIYENDFTNSKKVGFIPQGNMALKNVLFTPLVINNKAVGVIGLTNKPTDFTDKDKRIVSAFGEQAAIALNNSRTREALETSNHNLKISTEKYRALYENAPLAYQSLDIDGNIIDVNPQWLNKLGYAREEVIGKWFGKFLHPRMRPLFEERFPKFKKVGVVSGVEFKMQKKDGTNIDVSFEGCIGYDNKGNFRQTYCTFKDITSEKKAITKLFESEEKFKSLHNYAGIGIGFYTIDGIVIDYNETALGHLNKTNDEVVGKHIKELFPEKDALVYMERIAETLKVKHPLEFEDEIQLPNSIQWFKSSYSVIYNGSDEITGVQIMSLDITEIKEVQKTLESQNDQLNLHNQRLESLLRITKYKTTSKQELLDYALEEAIDLTQSKIGYIYFYNEETKQFSLNTWSNEVMSECQVMNPQTIYNLESTGCWGEVVRQQKPIVINDYSAPNQHKKGTPKGHVSLSKFMSIPVIIDDKIVAVAGVANKPTDYSETDVRQLTLLMDNVWNICERLDLVENLKKAKRRAEKADRLKSAFLANMSHEIRTPLNGLIGFTDVLATRKNISDPDRVRYADIIKQSGDQLLHIVNDILDISALENGSLEIIKRPFELNKILFNIYGIYERKKQTEKQNVILNLKMPTGNIELTNDENRFTQVLSNLIDNALKFTHEGKVEFGVFDISNSNITFFVSDTGIGIEKEQQAIIFDRFRQAEISSNRLYGGNGLGLSIVRELLQLMGGNIWVESNKDTGSVFYFTLPHANEKQATDEKQTDDSNRGSENKTSEKIKILVVEDDFVNQEYMKEMLSDIEADITMVAKGRDAISEAKENNFDVILMDIRLPDINGFDATKEIRKFNSKVPIIAQTAYAMSTDEEEAYQSGCTGYLSKPIKQEDLLDTLKLLAKT